MNIWESLKRHEPAPQGGGWWDAWTCQCTPYPQWAEDKSPQYNSWMDLLKRHVIPAVIKDVLEADE